jgi:hypothetical protein
LNPLQTADCQTLKGNDFHQDNRYSHTKEEQCQSHTESEEVADKKEDYMAYQY